MTPSLSSLDPANSEVNNHKIAASFASPNWYIDAFAANIRIRTETVATLVEGVTIDRILDIGCGDGSLSTPLLPRAKHMTYLDQSAAMLDLVRTRIGDQNTAEITYLKQHFMEAELPTTGYDLVICVGVMAYIKDIRPFLVKIRSLMRPGGMLILECTDAYHFVSRFVGLYRSITGIFKPKRFMTYPHRASEIVAETEAQALSLKKRFCYAYNLPILEKIIPQNKSYKWIRRMFGDVQDNRRAWLGKEHIFCFISR